MRRFLFLFLLSISGIPKFVNIKKIQKKLKNGPCQHRTGQKDNKKNKIKNTNTKIKCVGRTNLLYLLCLISNTIPQLEQSSLQQPSRVLHHRHLLQTTSYNHLLLHLLISRKEKPKEQQARNPPSRGVEKPEGPSALQPTTESLNIKVLG